MPLAIIKDGVVENLIVGDAAFSAHLHSKGIAVVEVDDRTPCSPGWVYADKVFTAPAVDPTSEKQEPTLIEKFAAEMRRAARPDASEADRAAQEEIKAFLAADAVVEEGASVKLEEAAVKL